MKIGIASDHRGYDLKKKIIEELTKENYEFIDYGTDSKESADYPDYAFTLGENVVNNNVTYGVAICGSGIGISIACNKVKGIRCAKVSTIEEAEVTRIDNNSNIIALSESVALETALEMVRKFVTTPCSQLEKHQRRINKIKEYEERCY